MGNYKNRGAAAETETEAACFLNEAFLFATMCIVGLPVDVHIRDGSVYSGTFHTASLDSYGIVLKEGRLVKKGKCNANVANGTVIETLVILSGDLVQIVAKGVLLPTNGVSGNIAGDNVEAAVSDVSSSEIAVSSSKKLNKFIVDKQKISQTRSLDENKNSPAHGFVPTKEGREHELRKVPQNQNGCPMEVEHAKRERDGASSAAVNERQIEDDWSLGELDQSKVRSELPMQKNADEVQTSSSMLSSFLDEAKPIEEGQGIVKLPNGVSSDAVPASITLDNQFAERPTSVDKSSPNATCSVVLTASGALADVAPESHSNSSSASADAVSPPSSEFNRSSKEFKLNPEAKTFSPSFVNPMSVTPSSIPTIANMAYIQSNPHMVPFAASQPEIGVSPFGSRSSSTAKFAPHSNLTAGNGGLQFSQPIVGHMGSRAQPLRYTSQYHAIQAGPPYAPPNSQAVVVGRLGQLMYMQPVSHDLVQSTTPTPPLPAYPLLSPHQVQYPKHQGTAAGQAVQLCVAQPLLAGGQQQFAMSSHFHLLQPPIPANRQIPVPGPNALFSTKFP